jgi:hypothetical protein
MLSGASFNDVVANNAVASCEPSHRVDGERQARAI